MVSEQPAVHRSGPVSVSLSQSLSLSLSPMWSLCWVPSQSSLSHGHYLSRCPKRSRYSCTAPSVGASGVPWATEPTCGNCGSPGRGQLSKAQPPTTPGHSCLARSPPACRWPPQSSGSVGSFPPLFHLDVTPSRSLVFHECAVRWVGWF